MEGLEAQVGRGKGRREGEVVNGGGKDAERYEMGVLEKTKQNKT